MCLALKEKSMSDNAKWYVIHTYSGYENAVKTSIEKFVTGRGMEDLILDMQIRSRSLVRAGKIHQ